MENLQGFEEGFAMLRSTFVAAALVLAASVAQACVDGKYAVSGEPLLPAPGVDVITIAGGTVAIASGCPAVPARIRETRRGFVVRAAWELCGSVGRVRLRALVRDGCHTMEGLFVSRRPPVRRLFVATRRGDVCDGIAGVPCPEGQFCEHPPGTCSVADQQGICVDVPGACPSIHDPVCGCDGVTYGNDCERQANRAQKAYDGPCRGPCTDVCDCYRTQTFPEPCPLDCATCDNYWTCEQGLCVPHCGPVPQPPPVCEPKVCGGIIGIGCAEGQSCELPPGTCGSADLEGECVEIPQACPDVYLPVCGCDGITYSNDCERRAATVQKAHDGACGPRCTETCDCYRDATFPPWCDALMCPACGCAWRCEQSECVLHIESPVPDPGCSRPG